MSFFRIIKKSVLFFVVYSGLAQQPGIQWQKCLGGSADDIPYCIKETSDGGYVSVGSTMSNNGDVTGFLGGSFQGDVWVTKINSVGVLQWQKALGGSADDKGSYILQTADGGYIIAGLTWSNDGNVNGHKGGMDAWVVKLNSSGVFQWQSSLGGTANDVANSIVQTPDGGYIIGGSTNSNNGDVSGNKGDFDYWIVKLNSSGGIQWQKCFGGTLEDQCSDVKLTSDGGYIVSGSTKSNDGDVTGNHSVSYDYWVLKLNASGVLQWQKTLGGTTDDEANGILETSDGGFIVAGNSRSSNGDVTLNKGGQDIWLAKLNSSGILQWEKSFGGSMDDGADDIIQTSDGGYICSGITISNNGDVSGNHGGSFAWDNWVVKTDNLGNLIWQKCLGGTSPEHGYSIAQTTDGGYIVAGNSASNDGDVSGNNNPVFAYDFWIVKLNFSVGMFDMDLKDMFTLYPIPSKESIIFETNGTILKANYSINSVDGKRVQSGKLDDPKTTIDISKLNHGIYLFYIEGFDQRPIKIIKQ